MWSTATNGSFTTSTKITRSTTTSAAKNPDKLRDMQELFLMEATKYNVFPLDNSILPRIVTPRPSATAGRTLFTYTGQLAGVPVSDAPSILNKSYTITADVDVPQGGGEGMLATLGGRFGGYGLYLLKGKPVFTYNLVDLSGSAGKAQTHSLPESTPLCLTSSTMDLASARAEAAYSRWTARKWPPRRFRTPFRSSCRLTRPSTSASTRDAGGRQRLPGAVPLYGQADQSDDQPEASANDRRTTEAMGRSSQAGESSSRITGSSNTLENCRPGASSCPLPEETLVEVKIRATRISDRAANRRSKCACRPIVSSASSYKTEMVAWVWALYI